MNTGTDNEDVLRGMRFDDKLLGLAGDDQPLGLGGGNHISGDRRQCPC